MIYVLHGDNEFEKSEALRRLQSTLGELDTLNYMEIEGRNLSAARLQEYADIPPFLGDQRMIVVHNLLTHLGSNKGDDGMGEWLAEYLPTLPESTVLILVEDKSMPARHPVMRALAKLPAEQCKVQIFKMPSTRGNELERWVSDHARSLGARLGRGVAADLASFIGPDLRLIHSELLKLQAYAGDRPITRDDVRLLTPYAQQTNIFAMVDALGNRQARKALHLLTQLTQQGAHPLYLLTMIVRQFRILLQVKELSAQGQSPDAIAGTLHLHPFVVKKAVAQARRYTMPQLTAVYDRLLETDLAIKTGQMEAHLALDLLVVELAQV